MNLISKYGARDDSYIIKQNSVFVLGLARTCPRLGAETRGGEGTSSKQRQG